MLLSRRSAAEDTLNPIARARAELEAAGAQLLDLSDSNPTRHGLLDPAVAEMLARAAANSTGYDPEPRGPVAAREALASRFGGDPDGYWLTPGTSAAYGWLFSLLTDPGEVVAAPRPGYPLLEPLARLAGTGLTHYPAFYLHPHGWEYDLDALSSVLAQQTTRAVAVVNPNNPTGAYAGQADAISGLCQTFARALIADEVFAPFRLDANPVMPVSSTKAGDPASGDTGPVSPGTGSNPVLPGPARPAETKAPLTFGLDGLSKLLAAPHLKLGWIHLSGPPADVARVAPVLDRIADAYLPVSGPAAAALPELLTLADTSIERINARLRRNLDTARTEFTGPGYRVRHCGGGWMVLVDVPRVLPGDDLVIALLRQGLAVQPGWFYDLDAPGVLALSLLPADFDERCRQLRTAIDALA